MAVPFGVRFAVNATSASSVPLKLENAAPQAPAPTAKDAASEVAVQSPASQSPRPVRPCRQTQQRRREDRCEDRLAVHVARHRVGRARRLRRRQAATAAPPDGQLSQPARYRSEISGEPAPGLTAAPAGLIGRVSRFPSSICLPSPRATPGSAALHNSLDLARAGRPAWLQRYWVAEHHNLANIASSSPEIMIGQIAAATSHLRVGSGGVMLPNHAPLMVAERFKVLEALFPGRIDLGLGARRAPIRSHPMRCAPGRIRAKATIPRTLPGIAAAGARRIPEGHPFRNVHAVPADVALPPIWLLGSSGLQRRACRRGPAWASPSPTICRL